MGEKNFRSLTEAEVAERLPQGKRFSFVGEVLELEPGKRILAKLIDVTKPEFAYLEDHFPGCRVNPGSIVQEALEQVGSIALSDAIPEGKIAVLAGTDKFRFRRFIKPTDEALLEAEITHLRSTAGRGIVKATVGGKIAVSGQVSFAIVDKANLSRD